MSRRYSIAEARSRLPSIVDQAEAGVEVELTRRGQPVAVLVSRREFERLRGKRLHFGDAYRKFLEKYSLDEIGLEDGFRGVHPRPDRRAQRLAVICATSCAPRFHPAVRRGCRRLAQAGANPSRDTRPA